MKKSTLMLAAFAMLTIAGCGDDVTNILEPDDLAPPLGLSSITGDEQVRLWWWCSNYDSNLLGYKIYMAETSAPGNPVQEIPAGFAAVDSLEVSAPSNTQRSIAITGLTNGTTYSFLVVAVKDEWNDISHTSNIVADTPRPETAAVARLHAKQVDEALAGFELSDFTIVDCTDLEGEYNTSTGGDIMAERFDPGAGNRLWLDGINGAQLQDIGYMGDWLDADVAPPDGYADTGHSVEALLGHVYAIRTADNHFAKIQVMGVNVADGYVEIKAAYQSQDGNTNYKK
jgi:hypothetical protein